jgi:hypothetical protein
MNFRGKKEVTRCDICGGRLTVPPGVYYRGRVMHLQEAQRMRREDIDQEITAPELTNTEQELNSILTNPTGTT